MTDERFNEYIKLLREKDTEAIEVLRDVYEGNKNVEEYDKVIEEYERIRKRFFEEIEL